MNNDTEMAILINDLDSIMLRIESLPPHQEFTKAWDSVNAAKDFIVCARGAFHKDSFKREALT